MLEHEKIKYVGTWSMMSPLLLNIIKSKSFIIPEIKRTKKSKGFAKETGEEK